MTINKSFALSEELSAYILKNSLRENALLRSVREENNKHHLSRMQIAPEQGQLMALLIKLMQASKILEIGVFMGYSSLCMALALPANGKIIACDSSKEFTDIAQKHWIEAGIQNKIELKLKPALETLNELIENGESESFDLAFIDADKANYLAYYEKCLQLIKQNGLILIDNVLWKGEVLKEEIKDNNTKHIKAFNEALSKDERIDICILPIADGLTLALKK